MKIAGHTMGTPEYTLFEAIDLFKKIGLDGIEIIVQTDGYPCAIPLDATKEHLKEVKEKLQAVGLEVSGLTPYLNLFNDLDDTVRQRECDHLKRIIDMAHFFETKNIRIYGGKFVDGEGDEDGAKLRQLVKSMRECGDYCSQYGIRLCMENHFGTMTTDARRTAEIANMIDHPNVGILYDQANIAFFPAEEYEEAIEIQKDKIFYVHCKDLVYRGGVPQKPKFNMVSHVKEEDRTVHSRIPGQGILNWPGIIRKLKEVGYDDWLSLEYERRWQQIDLPEASIGMLEAVRYIRAILESLQ
jgi:sugar phosphate isomerase/epimerase